MGAKQEYNFVVRRLIPASVAAFAIVLLFCSPSAQAQIHAGQAPATSNGLSGNFGRMPGTIPAATWAGPRGSSVPNAYTGVRPSHPFAGQQPFMHPHHHHAVFPAVGEVYAVPYYVPTYALDPDDDSATVENSDSSNYASGPTIFDRRGSGQSSQAAEAAYANELQSHERPDATSRRDSIDQPSDAAAVAAPPPPDQPPTLLIFKDGRQLELQNYAIVGSMLYDLTPGHRTRIALADLDLASTAKQNDDRGIDFQLPVHTDTN